MKKLLLIALIVFTTIGAEAQVEGVVTFLPAETHKVTSDEQSYTISMSFDGINVSTKGSGSFNRSKKDFYTISGFIGIGSNAGKITKVILTSNGDKGYTVDNFKSRDSYNASGYRNKELKISNNTATWTSTNGVDTLSFKNNNAIHLSKIEVFLTRTSAPQQDTITIGAAEYATYSSTNALDFTGSGLQAYIITSRDDTCAYMKEIDRVPANTGVVLHGGQGTYYVPTATDVDDARGNILLSTATDGHVSDGDCYSLGRKNSVVAFFNVKEGTEIKKGRAYFTSASGAKYFTISDDTATGIRNISRKSNIGNTAEYNIAGQKVDKNYKGLVIQNGKKIIRR